MVRRRPRPLATSWHSNKFLNPVQDGSGAAGPAFVTAIRSRIQRSWRVLRPEELESLFRGYGWDPYVVEGDDPAVMHPLMAAVTEHCITQIRAIQTKARTAAAGTPVERPRWPMIILRTPKGWTCPKEIDGHKLEGSWRAHQMPILDPVTNPHTSSWWKTGCVVTSRKICSTRTAL